ncbi:siderophore-interacting protein [Georgenia sp. Z1491]|uniref:siderophore-interacting protein n=1 Tax=Georgenia sp. Z1491 TaxID=3416707 RepID=UPI003CF648EE
MTGTGGADVVPTRAFRTTVARRRRLSPSFVRVTLTADELEHVGPQGTAATPEAAAVSPPAWDQRIKAFLPRADGTFPELGLFADPPASMMEWYTAWRQLDDDERNPIRTYTIRAIRTDRREIDVDFVLHVDDDGTSGPAAAWAAGAREGDDLVVIGPDRRALASSGGIEWSPGAARDVLLAGDETAVPAICAILEALPAGFRGEAYLEVPSGEDVLDVTTASDVAVHWLPRDGAPLGQRLDAAVRDWGRRRVAGGGAGSGAGAGGDGYVELDPDGQLWEVAEPGDAGLYAWLAGEAGVITTMRRHLVKELGMDRGRVSFMGYWKRGRSET